MNLSNATPKIKSQLSNIQKANNKEKEHLFLKSPLLSLLPSNHNNQEFFFLFSTSTFTAVFVVKLTVDKSHTPTSINMNPNIQSQLTDS